MKRQIDRALRARGQEARDVKLGRGGIREIEFLTQVFQLIRGGRDPALRERSTRKTLHLLAERELLSADTVEQLLTGGLGTLPICLFARPSTRSPIAYCSCGFG